MLGTILLLIFTIIVVPLCTFYFGTPLSELQNIILFDNLAWLVAGVIAYCFIVGEISKNNSQVDKLWSIVPAVYVWDMTYLADWNERMVLMSILVTIWAIRLTYNFARRGAYTWKFWAGEEDYRWEVLRKRPGFNKPFIWMLFNLFFICSYQNILIFLFTIPILTLVGDNSPLNWIDYLLSFLFVLFVLFEFVADNQQYVFQAEKHRRMKEGEALGDYEKGFIDTGLWGIVRHPNYAMEQAIWVVFYLFSVHITGDWINWSVAGCALLIILFKGSSDFSEEISRNKYQGYAAYQKNVPRFIPFTKIKKN
jgi:steroid 5-alpha reductase family enzyme